MRTRNTKFCTGYGYPGSFADTLFFSYIETILSSERDYKGSRKKVPLLVVRAVRGGGSW